MSLFDDIEKYNVHEITSSQFWQGILTLLKMGGEVAALIIVFIASIKGLALVAMVFPPAATAYALTPSYFGLLLQVIMKNYVKLPYDQQMKIARTCAVFNHLTDPSYVHHCAKIISGFQHSDVHKEIVSLVNNSSSFTAYSDFDQISSVMRSGYNSVKQATETLVLSDIRAKVNQYSGVLIRYHYSIFNTNINSNDVLNIAEKISKAVQGMTIRTDSDPLAEFLVWGCHENIAYGNAITPENVKSILAGYESRITNVEARFNKIYEVSPDFANLSLSHLRPVDYSVLEPRLVRDFGYKLNGKKYLDLASKK
jgi:hypothetical protein